MFPFWGLPIRKAIRFPFWSNQLAKIVNFANSFLEPVEHTCLTAIATWTLNEPVSVDAFASLTAKENNATITVTGKCRIFAPCFILMISDL